MGQQESVLAKDHGSQSFPGMLMVWAGICVTGKAPLVLTSGNVKINTDRYQQTFAKRQVVGSSSSSSSLKSQFQRTAVSTGPLLPPPWQLRRAPSRDLCAGTPDPAERYYGDFCSGPWSPSAKNLALNQSDSSIVFGDQYAKSRTMWDASSHAARHRISISYCDGGASRGKTDGDSMMDNLRHGHIDVEGDEYRSALFLL
ncbi:hypothetical protein KIN20_025136 [Parelaphostrongylus tenuis]|uniref:Uncharacterized protein n=1 Tax=Parelaphostrongylus tenuis TaxID=148309 RepID=A0AAD5NBN9_PARTN|nr:hypothetical protein KIN20_025136 [Parelaphostrongylus tenuis]